jgi:pyruvate,orthophosphate dikinase
MGKVCLVGCEALRIDLERRCIVLGDIELREGEVITLDGHRGQVYLDAVCTVEVRPEELLERLARLRTTAAT